MKHIIKNESEFHTYYIKIQIQFYEIPEIFDANYRSCKMNFSDSIKLSVVIKKYNLPLFMPY